VDIKVLYSASSDCFRAHTNTEDLPGHYKKSELHTYHPSLLDLE